MLVSQGPWWWMRVLPPGAVVTIDEYRFVEPATAAETAIARSMSAFCPVPTRNSEGAIRFAIRPMIPAARYDPGPTLGDRHRVAGERALDLGDVDLDHLQHGLHRPPRAVPVTAVEHLGHLPRHHLPGQPEAIL